jgi:allophanate hydrolase subunit 1
MEAGIDQVRRLARIWQEVLLLPPNQRAALLLNLRDADGQGVIELIPATGVATFDELAVALEIPVARLEEIWNDLPLDDNRIAEALGLNRQQVINLRKSARWRLSRRIARDEENIAPVRTSLKKVGDSSVVRRFFGGWGGR